MVSIEVRNSYSSLLEKRFHTQLANILFLSEWEVAEGAGIPGDSFTIRGNGPVIPQGRKAAPEKSKLKKVAGITVISENESIPGYPRHQDGIYFLGCRLSAISHQPVEL